MEGMLRICIEIDEDLLAKAAEELETSAGDAQATITEALDEIHNARKRIELVALISRPEIQEAFEVMERAEKLISDFRPSTAPSP